MNKKLYGIAKKYVVCLIFSADLSLLVLLSELIRLTIMNFASSSFMFYISVSMLLVGVVIPVLLLLIWFVNPIMTERLFATFGLTEKSLDSKKESEDKKRKKLRNQSKE